MHSNRLNKSMRRMTKFYHSKIVPNKAPIFIGMAILFLVGIALGLTVFSLRGALAADETCYWVGDTNPAVWNDATHWSSSSGGGGSTCAAPGGVPDSGTAVIFNASGLNGVTIDAVVSIDSLDLQAGYTGTFDNATQDKAITVANNVTMDNTRTDMGDAIWTVTGSFDNQDVTTFNRDLSTLVMNGTDKNIISTSAKPFNNLTISGTISVPSTGTAVYTRGTVIVSGTFTVAAAKYIYIYSSSNLQVTSTGTITGGGTLTVDTGSLTQQDGIINSTNFNILRLNGQTIVPATYDSANVGIRNYSDTPDRSWTPSATPTIPYTFTGNVTFTGNLSSTGTYTVNNSVNNPNFVFKGNVTFTNGTSTLNWTKGTGTITAGGTTAQSLNFLGKTVEDLNITNTGGTVSLLTSAVTTDSLTVASNATFDLAGNNMLYGAAANTTNNGTIKLKGSETLTNVNNLDTDSGTVTYTGNNNANTLTLKDFDYYNLTITDANVTKATFQPTNGSDLVVNGNFTLSSGTGTFDNATNDENITVTGDVTMDNTRTDMGDAIWTVSGSFDMHDVATLNKNLSTVNMNGSGKNIYLKSGSTADELYNFTIATGASITMKTYTGGSLKNVVIDGTFSIDSGLIFYAESGSTVVSATGRITGAGTYNIYSGSGLVTYAGLIDITYFIFRNPAGSAVLSAGQFQNLTITCVSGGAYTAILSAGTFTINQNFTLSNTSTGSLILNNSTNNPNLTIKGNLTISETTGAITYTKGAGTITAGGTTAQSLNFLGKTVEDLNITNTSATVSLLTSAVTTDSLTVAANATFDLAGQNISRVSTGSTDNSGTIKLKGSETLTNFNDLDTNSGTVIYNGAGAGTYELPEYGATDFNNLTINSTAGTDTFRPPASFGIGGSFTLTAGVLDNSNHNPNISIAGNVSTEAAPTWTKGTGTITLNGTAAQSLDFNDKTVEDIRDSNVTDTVTLTDGVTTDALTVDTGAKFDMNGQSITRASTGSADNSGTIYMRGNETLTNFDDMDTNSGWVEYNGGAAYATLPNYSYNNVNFNGAGSWTLGADLSANGELSISTGVLTSGSNNIDIGGKFTQAGGVLTNGSNNMTVGGAFERTGGTFTAGTGTVELDGANQTISGNTTFNNFKKNVAVARTLTFTQASTQTVSGTLDLKGASGQLLSLRSSVDGNYWNIVHNGTVGTYDVNYLDVKDSNHTGGADFIVFNSTNSGHNIGWAFPSYYGLSSNDGTRNAGEAGVLTITLRDASNNIIAFNGNVTGTFTGPSTGSGYNPEVNSTDIGSSTTFTLTAGTTDLPFTYYKSETSDTDFTDTIGISSNSPLSITVNKPTLAVAIQDQDNVGYLASPDVKVNTTAGKVQSSATAQTKLANSEVSLGNANYSAFTTGDISYTLPSEDGRHRVYGMLKDTYGNTSSIAESNQSAPFDAISPSNPDDVTMRDATSYPQEAGQDVSYGVLITWSPSTDSLSGVKGYVVQRDSKELNKNGSTGLTDDVQEVSGPSTSSGNKYFVDLESLEPNTSYTYSVKAIDNAGNVSSSSSASLQLSKNNEKSGQSEGQNTITLSTTAPISEAEGRLTNIKNVKATPSATSATIVWENNVPATCTVKYGTDTGYSNSAGSSSSSNGSKSSDKSSKTYNSKCKIVLTDLSAETSYHFKVVSADKDNVSVSSGDQTFTTLSQEEAQGLLEMISARLSEFFGGVWRNIKNFFETVFTDKAQAADNHANNADANDPHLFSPLVRGSVEGVNALSLRGVPIVLNTWTTWQSDVIVILSVAEGSHALTKGIPRLASLARDFASAQLYELYKPYKLYELFVPTPALAADNASSITDNNYSLSKSNLASKGNTMVPKVSVFDSAIASLRRYLFTPAYAADASSITSLHISDVSSIDGSFLAKTIYWPEGQGAVSVTRDGTTLGQTEANFYLDTTIEKGKDYTYAVNSLSTSSAQKAVLPGGTPKLTDLKAKATDVTQDSANIVVTWNTIGVPSSSNVSISGCKGNSGKADESLNEFHTVVVTGVDPESTCKVTASGKSKDGGSGNSSINYTVPEAQKQKTILEIIVNALHNAFRGFARWIQE